MIKMFQTTMILFFIIINNIWSLLKLLIVMAVFPWSQHS